MWIPSAEGGGRDQCEWKWLTDFSLQGAWGPFGAELLPHISLEAFQSFCLLILPPLRLPSQARLPSGLRHSSPEDQPWLVRAFASYGL